MKKTLLFPLLAVLLTSCDISSIIQFSNKTKDSIADGEHTGITLSLAGEENLLIKNRTGVYVNSDITTGIGAPTSTIKRLEGKITFYKSPRYQVGQLDEVGNDHPEQYYYEQEVNFKADKEEEYDFIYLTSINFSSNLPDSKLYKFFRVALLSKENDDYYVLSKDKEGITSKTEYNLDLDADGTLDKNQEYDWEENGELVNYTTGMPAYMTDNYDYVIPSEREIGENNIPSLKSLIQVDKPLIIRIWFEGWEINNEDYDSAFKVDVGLKFAGHKAQ